jgi:ATP-binding cassette subfamily B protein RaxB
MSMWQALQFGVSRKLRPILQTEAAECGLACLAMIGTFHGYQTDLPAMRRRFSLSLKGATLAQIMQVAAAMGFTTRPLRLDLAHLQQLRLPCILHWDFNHFVVLKEVLADKVVIIDSAIGEKTLALPEFSKHFTGVALEVTPAAGFEPTSDRQPVRLTRMLGRATGLKGALGKILAMALALEVFAIASPFLMQLVVDQALVSGDRDLIITLGFGFLLLLFIQVAVSGMRSWMVIFVGSVLNIQWLGNLFRHLLRLPIPYFEKRHLGDVVSRFGSINTIQRTLTNTFIEALVDGVMAIGTVTMMLIYNVWLSVISIAVMLVYGLVRWLWYQPLRDASEESIINAAKQQSHFLESIRGIQSIRLFNRTEERHSSWVNLVVKQMNADLRTMRHTLFYRVSNMFLFGSERIVVIWLGAYAVLDATFSIGMLFAYLAYKDQFSQRVAGLIDKVVDFKMLQLHGERLADIVDTPAERGVDRQQLELPKAEANLEVRDVGFQYASAEPWVLQSCNLVVRDGEAVAIVGASGCGKTTLLKLMLGLMPPSSGSVMMGGSPIDRFGLAEYRSMIASVMQDDHLFAGTLLDNICFFDAQPDHAWVEECAKSACVHDDIMSMPMGYRTLIGDMGTALSGGQKQRVLLARALYRRPKILFLDEATSHLDIKLEKQVNAAIRQMKLTRVIIAHRPETIAMADRVVVLHTGKVVQEIEQQPDKSEPTEVAPA